MPGTQGKPCGEHRLSGWVHRHQADVIAYLVEENRVQKEQMKGRALRLADDQRRRLAELCATTFGTNVTSTRQETSRQCRN